MKTAMQQAIEDYFEYAGPEIMSGYTAAAILKDYLEKEKQQIIDACNNCILKDGEQYYNETFKND